MQQKKLNATKEMLNFHEYNSLYDITMIKIEILSKFIAEHSRNVSKMCKER